MESFYLTPENGFRRVKQGHFAFFCEEPTANRYIRMLFEPHEICETKKVYFSRNDLAGFALKKFSPFRERIFLNYMWLSEVGIAKKILHYWNDKDIICKSSNHFESVRIEYLVPIFVLLLLAHVVSSFILVCEIFYKKKNIRKRRPCNSSNSIFFE